MIKRLKVNIYNIFTIKLYSFVCKAEAIGRDTKGEV